MKKKILSSLLLSTVLLASCGSSSDDTSGSSSSSDTPRYSEYKTAEFIIDVPEEWETVNSFDSSYPDGIRVAFKDNVKDGDFIANLTVIREDNEDLLTSFDVIQDKLSEHNDHLLNYELISEEELTLSVGGGESKTTLFTFSGKNDTTSETLNFMQLALAKTDRAYIVTASYRPNEDEFVIERLETMLKSFELR